MSIWSEAVFTASDVVGEVLNEELSSMGLGKTMPELAQAVTAYAALILITCTIIYPLMVAVLLALPRPLSPAWAL